MCNKGGFLIRYFHSYITKSMIVHCNVNSPLVLDALSLFLIPNPDPDPNIVVE
jgi:hypothetical protein